MARKLTNDRTITAYISEGTSQWYYVTFDDSGNANFYIEPKNSDLDIDLYVYESDMETLIDQSRKGTGKSELINIPVTAGEKYYVQVEHYRGPSPGKYEIRCKNYPTDDNREVDLGIISITPTSSEPFTTGEEVRFKIKVKNYKDSKSPKYKVAVYKGNRRLDVDDEPALDAKDYGYAYLDVTIDESGEHSLTFKIEMDNEDTDSNDNVKVRTYTWKGANNTTLIDKFVSIAKEELEKGFKENNGDNMTPYGEWYGLNGQPWCAMFVSWCANKAGILNDIVPKYASCTAGAKWYKDKEKYKSRESGYIPKCGDVIFYYTNGGINHTGIVIACDPNDKKVYTIEGNSSNTIKQRQYKLNNTYIDGYGINGGNTYGEIPNDSTDGTGSPTN